MLMPLLGSKQYSRYIYPLDSFQKKKKKTNK